MIGDLNRSIYWGSKCRTALSCISMRKTKEYLKENLWETIQRHLRLAIFCAETYVQKHTCSDEYNQLSYSFLFDVYLRRAQFF